MQGWHGFTDDMQSCYGVDMRCLDATFEQEQQQYYLQTSAWADVHPSQLQGPPACLRTYDLATLTQQELEAPLQVRACRATAGAAHAAATYKGMRVVGTVIRPALERTWGWRTCTPHSCRARQRACAPMIWPRSRSRSLKPPAGARMQSNCGGCACSSHIQRHACGGHRN